MRITGHRMLEISTAASTRATAQVAESSEQITSGTRVAVASDDPLAWAQARRADARATIDRGRGDAVAGGRDYLNETESSLVMIIDMLGQARELATAANNGSLGAADRAVMGVQARTLFNTALDAANARTSAGDYVLGGSMATSVPFDAGGVYQGDTATRAIELSDGSSGVIAVAGDVLSATSGVDVLPIMDQLATALASNDLPTIQTLIATLAQGHDQALAARTSVGVMQRALNDSDDARSDLAVRLATQISDLTDTDIAVAASDLARGTASLEASQIVSARLAALLRPQG